MCTSHRHIPLILTEDLKKEQTNDEYKAVMCQG